MTDTKRFWILVALLCASIALLLYVNHYLQSNQFIG